MTDQNQSHPTQGRRRRHKSPACLPAAQHTPLSRLLDHMEVADDPSDEEEEKDAKRQRSEPTTPGSTFSRPPHEYDEVMGITHVEPRDAERFEEGNYLDSQDAEEVATRETDIGDKTGQEALGLGESMGDSAVLLYESALRGFVNVVLLPPLPSTLGKELRNQPTRHRGKDGHK